MPPRPGKRWLTVLGVGAESLPLVEEFNCLEVLVTSEGKMEHKIDSLIGAATAVMRLLYRSVVVKKNQSRKSEAFDLPVYVPTITSGY